MQKSTIVVLELMKTFDAWCRDKSIKYVVGGMLPRALLKHSVFELPFGEVYIQSNDLISLVADAGYFEEQGLFIEHGENNPNCHDFSVRIVDESTTYIDGYQFGRVKHMGIFLIVKPVIGFEVIDALMTVTVNDSERTTPPLSSSPDNHNQEDRTMDDRRMATGAKKHVFARPTPLYFDRAPSKGELLFCGCSLGNNGLENTCNRFAPDDDGPFFAENTHGCFCQLPSDVFENMSRGLFCGYELNLPVDAEPLHDAIYRNNRDVAYPSSPSAATIIDADIPYDEIVSRLPDADVLSETIQHERARTIALKSLIEHQNEEIDSLFSIVKELYEI